MNTAHWLGSTHSRLTRTHINKVSTFRLIRSRKDLIIQFTQVETREIILISIRDDTNINYNKHSLFWFGCYRTHRNKNIQQKHMPYIQVRHMADTKHSELAMIFSI